MRKLIIILGTLLLGVVSLSQPGQAKDLTLTLSPEIVVVFLGDTTHFAVEVLDSSGNLIDTTLSWEFTTNRVGSIDSNGVFFAEVEGLGFLRVFIGDASDIATVIVQDSSADSTGIQTVKIIRAKKNPKAPADTLIVEEGSFYKLSRFQFPLNVVNGGIMHFQIGSLTEDILLKIELSSVVVQNGDSLIYPDSIINAVNFKVFINDSLETPYFFQKPVKLAIPFKRGLLKHIGVSPFEIGMFFFNDSSGMDSVGVTNIAVDTVANRIFADLNRFETIILAKKRVPVSIIREESAVYPKHHLLLQNYPNPFNPVTTLEYVLPTSREVLLTIYNLLGEEVARLIDRKQNAGNYQITWNASNFASGIYIYRITAGDFVQTRKMVLLK